MKNRLGAAIVAAALALATPAQPQAAREHRRPPNIVILLADDWGFSDVGAFGSEIATPNIDWLAANGTRFSNFHVAGSCSPTRAMLQTGVGNHRAGLGNMPETIPPQHIGARGYDTVLALNTVTIAELLRAQGYRTYLTGKWHLGKDARRIPTARGYDHAFSLADAGADNFEQRPIEGMYATAEWTEDGRPANLPANYYSSTFVVDQMIAYIEADRASGKPFLASINFLANHIPVQAHDADIARYAGMYRDGWAALRSARAARARARGVIPANAPMGAMQSNEDWAALSTEDRASAVRVMQAYGAMASAMDRAIGRLIAHLRAHGDLDNTLFVFLSDNGAEPMEPMARWRNRQYLRWQYDMTTDNIGRRNSFASIGPSWASAAVSPLSGYKFSATEGGLRVPLIIAWPGNGAVRRGAIVPAMAHVTDIAPTIIEASGAGGHGGTWAGRSVEPMIGRSLWPALTGAAQHIRPDDQPLGYELSGNAALFRGVYKLVKNLPPIGDGRWRLFDIESDSGETRDLAAAEPALFAQMQADYAAYAARDGVLAMPDGYTFNDQINDNAFENIMKPRLIRLGAWIAVVLAFLAGAWWWWRRRYAHRAPA
ncbi:MAG: arylsulfatase [Sphingopyxis sp.]